MINVAISSKADYKYIQPHLPLADNIVSHGVSPKIFLRILNEYGGLSMFHLDIITKYYYEDLILEVDTSKNRSCYIMQRQDYTVDSTLEFVGENRHSIFPLHFPLAKNYHHERQSIILKSKTCHALQLEILVEGIIDPVERLKDIPIIIEHLQCPPTETGTESESTNDALSLSYRIHVNGMNSVDLQHCVSKCVNLT